jgi:hypothetical protein
MDKADRKTVGSIGVHILISVVVGIQSIMAIKVKHLKNIKKYLSEI